jgi:hypothetical protein
MRLELEERTSSGRVTEATKLGEGINTGNKKSISRDKKIRWN